MGTQNPEAGMPGTARRDVLKAAAIVGGGAVGSAILPVAANAASAASPGHRPREPRGRKTLRELGVVIGEMKPGRYNNITDVPGVQVGYKTLISDSPIRGVRTGVTIINPRAGQPMWENYCYAGYRQLNGNGEMTGIHWVKESGWLTSMIGITTTNQAGLVRDALIKWEAQKNPKLSWGLPVVAETFDGFLNNTRAFAIQDADVYDAVADLQSGKIAQGCVGGGTGMVYCDFKGGTGSASRLVPYNGKTYTVGVLIQTNYGYGRRQDFRVNGVPVGAEIPYSVVPGLTPGKMGGRGGSSITIVATDAPMLPDQCERMAERAILGLGRAACFGANGDGDLEFCFSTGNTIPTSGSIAGQGPAYREAKTVDNGQIDIFFHAAVTATMEAAINSACMATTMHGYNGTVYELPLGRMVHSVKHHRMYPGGYS